MKKIMLINKIIPLLFIGVFLLAGRNNSALAQFDLDLSVSPPISYLQVPPGTVRQHTVVLENSGDKTLTVVPSIVDFTSDGKSGRTIITNELSFPYITFGTSDIQELAIPAGKKAQLTLYIDVPHDADEREYPLTILFFSKRSGNYPIVRESQSQVTGAIGSNLVVLVSKEVDPQKTLSVIDLNTAKFVDSFGTIEFTPLVVNESLASMAASGSAQILNWKKQPIAEFDIYPDIVLGKNSRELRALREGTSPDKPETGMFSYKPKLLLGPYQIVIDLQNQEQVNTQHAQVIYAFPFSIVLVLIVGATVVYIYRTKI